MAEDDGITAEDFGLGADFDQALADATTAPKGNPNASNSKKGDSSQGGGAPESDRLARADFSKLKMILDVPLKVSVELGRTKMLVNDLLQLGQGSVIELDKIAGEPMEILINDKLVAMGEVVVVNEKFGVRLTDVVSQFGLGDLDKISGPSP